MGRDAVGGGEPYYLEDEEAHRSRIGTDFEGPASKGSGWRGNGNWILGRRGEDGR